MKLSIVEAVDEDQVAEVKSLFLEYADALDFSIAHQGFEEEMATFPGAYAPPDGVLLLALVADNPAAAVGLRPLGEETSALKYCEMKRLYVRPDHRGLGLGRKLSIRLIERAREAGYEAMRLDTVLSMTAARGLYRSLGFSAIPSYNESPLEGAEYYELALT